MTYAIRAARGSGIVSLNGSAARRASVGDLVILAAFVQVPSNEAAAHKPKLVFVDEGNRMRDFRDHVPVQT